MHQLKPIDRKAIPRALAKAERYRLLNEPREAESICLDILAADPGNQDALICLILSLSDLLESRQSGVNDLRALTDRLASGYARLYYRGVVEERWAKALMKDRLHPQAALDAIHAAMRLFEQAEPLAPDDNDDAVLRWNTCVRLLERAGSLSPRPRAEHGQHFDDDVPPR